MPVNIGKSYKYVNCRIRNIFCFFLFCSSCNSHDFHIFTVKTLILALPILSYRDQLHGEQRHILGGLLYLRCGGGGAPVAILSWVCKVKSTL